MKMDSYKVIGVMSGTSLDGIDLCYVSFEYDGIWGFRFIYAETIAYPDHWRTRLREAISLTPEQIEALELEYTAHLGNIINSFIDKHGINTIDAVCSHGHTIFHQPWKGITLQIGNRPELAEAIGHKVVCDFRVQDVKLGGQGAPLVPIGDKLLFSNYDACLNLGGFSNVSYDLNGSLIAYDICPVNIVLNKLSGELGVPYDHDGQLARSGEIHEAMLSELNRLEFYTSDQPKSLGLEWVQENIDPIINSYYIEPKDKLATFVEHIVQQIAIRLNPYNFNKVLITGGGALNSYLIERMETNLNAIPVIPGEQILEFKEALIFALLGVLRIRNEVNCLKSVTGASTDHSSGEIYLP